MTGNNYNIKIKCGNGFKFLSIFLTLFWSIVLLFLYLNLNNNTNAFWIRILFWLFFIVNFWCVIRVFKVGILIEGNKIVYKFIKTKTAYFSEIDYVILKGNKKEGFVAKVYLKNASEFKRNKFFEISDIYMGFQALISTLKNNNVIFFEHDGDVIKGEDYPENFILKYKWIVIFLVGLYSVFSIRISISFSLFVAILIGILIWLLRFKVVVHNGCIFYNKSKIYFKDIEKVCIVEKYRRPSKMTFYSKEDNQGKNKKLLKISDQLFGYYTMIDRLEKENIEIEYKSQLKY